jgi:predicted Zn-ribbon and HTH transcriptional regulator
MTFKIGSTVECRVCGYVNRVSTLTIGNNTIQQCSICSSTKIQQADIMFPKN